MRETALPHAGSCRDIVRVELSGEGAAYVIDPLGRSSSIRRHEPQTTSTKHKPWRVKVSKVKASGSGRARRPPLT
jgi:hypothetical protein